MRFSPGCACCDTPYSCAIGSDTFDVASYPSPLSADWDKRVASSDAQIIYDGSGGSFQTTISDDAVIYQTAHPGGTADQIVVTRVLLQSEGDEAKIILGWEDDENYLFVLIRGGSCSRVELWRRTAGDNVLLETEERYLGGAAGWWNDANIALNTYHWVWLCYSNDKFSFYLDTAYGSDLGKKHTFTTPGPAGLKVGLGSGTVNGSVRFSTFEYHRHVNASDPSCPSCSEPPYEDCYIFTERFATATGTTLSCHWIDVDGATYSRAGKLLAVSSDNSKFVVARPHPDGGTAEYSVHVEKPTLSVSPSGTTYQYGAVVDYLDADNYHYVMVTNCDGLDEYLEVFKVSSGTPTRIGRMGFEYNGGSFGTGAYALNIQITKTASGDVLNVNGYHVSTTFHDGPHVGLLTGDLNGATLSWNQYLWTRHEHDVLGDCFFPDPLDCTGCTLFDDQCGPPMIVATLAGMANQDCYNCADYDGEYYMDWTGSTIGGYCGAAGVTLPRPNICNIGDIWARDSLEMWLQESGGVAYAYGRLTVYRSLDSWPGTYLYDYYYFRLELGAGATINGKEMDLTLPFWKCERLTSTWFHVVDPCGPPFPGPECDASYATLRVQAYYAC